MDRSPSALTAGPVRRLVPGIAYPEAGWIEAVASLSSPKKRGICHRKKNGLSGITALSGAATPVRKSVLSTKMPYANLIPASANTSLWPCLPIWTIRRGKPTAGGAHRSCGVTGRFVTNNRPGIKVPSHFIRLKLHFHLIIRYFLL